MSGYLSNVLFPSEPIAALGKLESAPREPARRRESEQVVAP